MVVAHPDDCVIFGWPIIKKYNDLNWKILYLTYDEKQARGQEIKEFWQTYQIPVEFCGIIDNIKDLECGEIISFNKDEVSQHLLKKIPSCDLLVTHGHDGEYGHPHHIFVHNVLKKINIPKIFFSNRREANVYINGETLGSQDLTRLPLHKDVIEMFPHRYHGLYYCEKSLEDFVKKYQ